MKTAVIAVVAVLAGAGAAYLVEEHRFSSTRTDRDRVHRAELDMCREAAAQKSGAMSRLVVCLAGAATLPAAKDCVGANVPGTNIGHGGE